MASRCKASQVPFWQTIPASILKYYRKQIPTRPTSRPAIRIILIAALILGVVALTVAKFHMDKALGSALFVFSVPYDQLAPHAAGKSSGRSSARVETSSCPCRHRALPWGSFAAWNSSVVDNYMSPARFDSNTTASVQQGAFMSAQCSSLIMASRDGPYNVSYPVVTPEDVALFVPGTAYALGLNTTAEPPVTLSSLLARKDVSDYLDARSNNSANSTSLIDNLPPGLVPKALTDYWKIPFEEVLRARLIFCESSLRSANEIIIPPDPATGRAVYRTTFQSSDLEDVQTVVDAFHREIGLTIWQACKAQLEIYTSHFNMAGVRLEMQIMEETSAQIDAIEKHYAGSPVPAQDLVTVGTFPEKKRLAELDISVAQKMELACMDFHETMRLFVLSNMAVNHSAYAEHCKPGPFCIVTKSKTALHWVTDALATLGGQWTTLLIVTNMLWLLISMLMQQLGSFENVTEDLDAPLPTLSSAPASLGSPPLKADQPEAAKAKCTAEAPGPAADHVQQTQHGGSQQWLPSSNAAKNLAASSKAELAGQDGGKQIVPPGGAKSAWRHICRTRLCQLKDWLAGAAGSSTAADELHAPQ